LIGRSVEQEGNSGYVRCSPDHPLSRSLVVLHLIFLSLRCFLFARRPDHLRRARGYFVNFIPPQRATYPSPVPLRLVKAPVAGHPLPKGEGSFDSSHAHQRGQSSPRGEGGERSEPGEGSFPIPLDLVGTPHKVFALLVRRDWFWYIYKLSA
jgi:hypothetical protein